MTSIKCDNKLLQVMKSITYHQKYCFSQYNLHFAVYTNEIKSIINEANIKYLS